VVLDFGTLPFPVLEGQSIGIIPPGNDAAGRPHHARQYSISSPRNGERPGYNNVSLTIKRVLEDHEGRPVRGVASNYMCDLKVGDKVQVIGPFGASFLMPNHPRTNIVMICTGTGSAPMRAMTEWRRRLRQSGKFEGGKLLLFFGARTKEELPYFGPLKSLPKDFIDINFAFSRTPDQPKRYVQDLMRERAADLEPPLEDGDLAPDGAPVRFQLRLARAPQPDAAPDAREMGPHAGEPREEVFELAQLDLELRLVTPGAGREDVENDLGAVHDPHPERLFQVGALHR
jgi:benzoyl-CoA 2,3-dioxygenase component A